MRTVLKICWFCIKVSILIYCYLTLCYKINAVSTKIDLSKRYLMHPNNGKIENLYQFSQMKYYTRKYGITYYAPVYIKLNELRDSYIDQAVEQSEKIIKEGVRWNNNNGER